MASPSKRRKLNTGAKAKPSTARNLDYFFSKKKDETPDLPKSNEDASAIGDEALSLTDEQLARKLQDEWDQEAAGGSTGRGANTEGKIAVADDQIPVRDEKSKELIADSSNSRTEVQGDDIYGAEDLKSTKTNSNEPAKGIIKAEGSSMFGNTLALQSAGSAEDTITSTIPFDESPLVFEPSRYIPDLKEHWAAEGGDASYALLTRCFVLVNSTQSRIKIVDTIVNLLRTIIEGDPSSLLPTVRSIIAWIHKAHLPVHCPAFSLDCYLLIYPSFQSSFRLY